MCEWQAGGLNKIDQQAIDEAMDSLKKKSPKISKNSLKNIEKTVLSLGTSIKD